MENAESVTVMKPNIQSEAEFVPEGKLQHVHTTEDKQKYNEPLINVIQKLTEMVESGRSSRFIDGKKRSFPVDTFLPQEIQDGCATPSQTAEPEMIIPKKIKDDAQIVDSKTDNFLQGGKKVMFYQCSLCKFISPSFESLTTHVKNHGQQNEIILMCSECHMTFKTHDELECHIKRHFENEDTTSLRFKDHPQQNLQLSNSPALPGRKKWYSHEEYGLYRCLICRYTCGQQRMLKTHAWKHAGEVDCSYPIFEEYNESAGLPDSTVAHTPQGSESVLSEDIDNKQHAQVPDCDTGQVPLEGTMKTDVQIETATPASLAEVIVVEDALSDTESLLSSAHEIISCSQTKKGHVNVIVERLPGAEETISQKPFLIDPEPDEVKKNSFLSDSLQTCDQSVDLYHVDKNAVETEEIVIGWSNNKKSGSECKETDENFPPVRRRTNSECLRLHSLAAEALVTMPIRLIECPKSSLHILDDSDSIDPDTGQRDSEASNTISTKLVSTKISDDLNNIVPDPEKEMTEISDNAEAPMKKGISMSLLKVIEKLRERTDQNATDDDILKELQDNAQCESTSDLPSGSNLVEYLPHAERPYRCRLCHYTSDNKGYIKQHLRVHRQRQPYQCPICEHIACNSGDLENHMINHCKTRMYECKQCAESFYYKGQLRTHERERHSLPDSQALSATNSDPEVCSDEVEEKYSPEGDPSSSPKMYGCDICNYKSPTYIGVRNHKRIHNSDKPYRCQVCNFATTNMNSLKCHLRRHPEEHQSVYLVDQYKCSLCGYVCSHPPSLKSHMWKHASDQNYNYEQVNKAINEAMSQSSRVPVESERKTFFENSGSRIDTVVRTSASQPANETAAYIEMPKVNPSQITLCSTEKLQNQIRPGTELCVLLFCCCICGFESTSKELLMEHMKAHEGEIINIILNKSESTS